MTIDGQPRGLNQRGFREYLESLGVTFNGEKCGILVPSQYFDFLKAQEESDDWDRIKHMPLPVEILDWDGEE